MVSPGTAVIRVLSAVPSADPRAFRRPVAPVTSIDPRVRSAGEGMIRIHPPRFAPNPNSLISAGITVLILSSKIRLTSKIRTLAGDTCIFNTRPCRFRVRYNWNNAGFILWRSMKSDSDARYACRSSTLKSKRICNSNLPIPLYISADPTIPPIALCFIRP